MPAAHAKPHAAATLLSLLSVAAPAMAAPQDATAALPPLDATTALLVIAPHPDDETLCCAGVIQRVAQAGGRVSILWLTSGDGSELELLLIEHTLRSHAAALELGRERMQEARAASARLGVPPSGQLFLGYPDGGLAQLLGAQHGERYTSAFTGAAAVPYREALFPGHPYTADSLQRDFAAVLARVRPSLVLAPSERDSHPDHRAAGVLTATAAAAHDFSVRYWIVHGGEGWPSPRALMPGIPLTAAPRSQGLAQDVFRLESAEEDRMLEALNDYGTQMRTIGPFLVAFVRSSELFAAQPGAEAAE